MPGATSFAAAREAQLDRLADLIDEHVDTDALRATDRARRARRTARPSPPEGACSVFLTTADTEILAGGRTPCGELRPTASRRCAARTRADDRTRPSGRRSTARASSSCRLLGGRRAWQEGVDCCAARCRARASRCSLLGGEAEPDAELTALSTAPAGAVAQAFEYLRHGGVDNIEQLLRFLADTFLLEGHGFEPPREVADHGVYVPGAAT